MDVFVDGYWYRLLMEKEVWQAKNKAKNRNEFYPKAYVGGKFELPSHVEPSDLWTVFTLISSIFKITPSPMALQDRLYQSYPNAKEFI